MARRMVVATLMAMSLLTAAKLDQALASDDDQVLALAAEHHKDPQDLRAAAATVGVPPAQYLRETVGELPPSSPDQAVGAPTLLPGASTVPIGGALGQRLLCVERYESNHTGSAVNPSSGARGWLQWLPSTARAWGVVIGDRASEWSAAARMAARGEAFFRSQWVVVQRGLC